MHSLCVEYSGSLRQTKIGKGDSSSTVNVPFFQGRAHAIMDGVEYNDLALITQSSLYQISEPLGEVRHMIDYQEHIDSGLFTLVLEIVDVRP